MPLSELLYNFKQQTIGLQEVKLIREAMAKHQLQHIPLWRISSLVKLTIGTARLQAYLIIYAGMLFVPPVVYEKYKESPQKLTRLAIYSPIALTFLLAPLIFYRRTSKKILTAIDYHLPTNTFQLTTFRKQIFQVPVSQLIVRHNPKKQKIVHEIEFSTEKEQNKIFKIQGYGEWQSAEFFRYLRQKGGLSQQL